MPELPEVETIRLGLEKYLVGHRIVGVEVRLGKIVTGDTHHVIGAKVTSVERFGKGLVIHLDNEYALAIHIKLTGQLVYREVSPHFAKASRGKQVSRVKVIKGTYAELPNKWTHAIFKLDRGAVLYYNDFRQFGWIKIVQSSKVKEQSFFKDLGPEFVISHPEFISGSRSKKMLKQVQHDRREALTLDLFQEILSKSGAPVKVVLMDQKKMSGIGNIYANDGLNLAKIDPRRKANTLSDEEVKILYEALATVLKRGLKYGGASELSYVNALGEEGAYQKHFLAYGRDGERCFNCGGTIEKISLGGRGTYFCPACQG